MPCYVELGNENGFPHDGVVDFVDNHVDPATGTMRIRGVFKNRSGALVPGLYARMKVPGSGRYRALLCPTRPSATTRASGTVLVVGKDDKVDVRPVKLGALFGGLRAIVSGIGAEDRILTNGQIHVQPGAPVKPTEVAITADEGAFSDPGPAVARSDAAIETGGPRSALRAVAIPVSATARSAERGRSPLMRLAFFFIERPVFAGVISIVTVIVGAIAAFLLPIAQFPAIAPPTVTVTANYPGANAKTVAETVATPIEEQVNGVEGHALHVEPEHQRRQPDADHDLQLGTNLDIAQVQVQNRVAIAQPVLPPEVQRAGVVVKKASPDITLVDRRLFARR